MASKFRNAGQTCVSTNRFDCGLIIGLGLGFDLGFSTGLGLGLVAYSLTYVKGPGARGCA